MSRDEFSDLSWDHDNENFDRQSFKKGLSGKFSFEELTGNANTRPNTPEKKKNVSRNRSKKNVSSVFEKPSALINGSKSKEQSKENKGFLRSVWDMFHGDDTKERKMTISSRNTVEEIKEQLEKLYDRIKEYEEKLEDKSKEISSKLVDLSKKTSKLNREINRSQSRINMFKKQIKGYEADLEKIKDKDDLMKQSIIDGKIKELNFKIQEEQKKIGDAKSKLKPLSEQKEALQKKSKEIKKSIADLKKKSVAIDHKLGRYSVSKESTFEILRRSIKERRELEPSQVSAGDLSFRATFNSKTYNMQYQKTRGGIPGFSGLKVQGGPRFSWNGIPGFSGLKVQGGPRFSWIDQCLKRAEQNGFSVTPSNENERDDKEHGGKDNPEDR